MTVLSGNNGGFTVSGTDPNTPAALPLTFSVVQSPSGALAGLTVTPQTSSTASVTFQAPVLPLGQVTNTVVTLSISAQNALAITSAPDTTTVTVKPLPDVVTITATEYRNAKTRLVINATSSVISPNVVLTLQPYTTQSGAMFDPASLGATLTNNLDGTYLLTLVGAPKPAPDVAFIVASNLGGVSAPHGLDRLR